MLTIQLCGLIETDQRVSLCLKKASTPLAEDQAGKKSRTLAHHQLPKSTTRMGWVQILHSYYFKMDPWLILSSESERASENLKT